MDLYPEYFQRTVWKNTGGLVTRTLEEVVGGFILWNMGRFMPHVYIYERYPTAEEDLSDQVDRRTCYSVFP